MWLLRNPHHPLEPRLRHRLVSVRSASSMARKSEHTRVLAIAGKGEYLDIPLTAAFLTPARDMICMVHLM